MGKKMKQVWKIGGSLLFFLVLIYFLEGWGVLGVLIFILGIVSMRCWKERNFLKHMMKVVELTIFGKPLDKDMWNKGEMKNTKVQIVWGGKSKVDMNKYIIILVYPALLLLAIGVMWNITSVTIISIVFFSIVILVKIYYWIRRSIKNVQQKEKNKA